MFICDNPNCGAIVEAVYATGRDRAYAKRFYCYECREPNPIWIKDRNEVPHLMPLIKMAYKTNKLDRFIRNTKMAEDFLSGMSITEIVAKYGLNRYYTKMIITEKIGKKRFKKLSTEHIDKYHHRDYTDNS